MKWKMKMKPSYTVRYIPNKISYRVLGRRRMALKYKMYLINCNHP